MLSPTMTTASAAQELTHLLAQARANRVRRELTAKKAAAGTYYSERFIGDTGVTFPSQSPE